MRVLLVPVLKYGVMDPAPPRYVIRINGHLGAGVLSAFPALASAWHGAHTVLAGPLDRSALYGGLAEIEAPGLDLLEIRQLTPGPQITGIRRQQVTLMAANFGPTSAARSATTSVPSSAAATRSLSSPSTSPLENSKQLSANRPPISSRRLRRRPLPRAPTRYYFRTSHSGAQPIPAGKVAGPADQQYWDKIEAAVYRPAPNGGDLGKRRDGNEYSHVFSMLERPEPVSGLPGNGLPRRWSTATRRVPKARRISPMRWVTAFLSSPRVTRARSSPSRTSADHSGR